MMRMVSSSPFSFSVRDTCNQEHRPLYGSNGVPRLFASHDAILAEDYARIIENECRTLESDSTVLLLVDPVLFTVPFFAIQNV